MPIKHCSTLGSGDRDDHLAFQMIRQRPGEAKSKITQLVISDLWPECASDIKAHTSCSRSLHQQGSDQENPDNGGAYILFPMGQAQFPIAININSITVYYKPDKCNYLLQTRKCAQIC